MKQSQIASSETVWIASAFAKGFGGQVAALAMTEVGRGFGSMKCRIRGGSPSPHPLPVKNGERE
ncbi:hypothetical protein EAS62_14590 [Bradyrhizobium zhanjiangense]|uniref:Uncharacterized protein n=1 Tax=Bradyrhizobium zhanjiangense TaxID=1325107 RepID=A0ABY0DKH6_9BRAD|nr:hypothetical protein EAS62_14590 [Bradyrhizobium zhanjiangense]